MSGVLAHKHPALLDPLCLRGRTFAWGTRTYVMGIINATPDSFSSDGVFDDPDACAAKAAAFTAAGCDIIDVGGESTRPGHQTITAAEEVARVLPAIRAIRARTSLPISVDTFKPQVAGQALAAGADLVNCVWGAVRGIVDVAREARAPLVVMHNRTTPDYTGDCVQEVLSMLERSAREAQAMGIPRAHIIVDPGIGFGKTADHNVAILRRLWEFVERLPYPLLIGTSRKSFLAKLTGRPISDRVFATAATVALAIASGADIVRVHDVAELMPVVDIADAFCRDGHVPRPNATQDNTVSSTMCNREAARGPGK